MKTRRRLIRKIVLATVLILLCAAVTVVLKETLDTQDPEAALPIITITYEGTPILEQNIYRAGYDWSFFTTVERWQAPSLVPEDLPIVPQEVAGGSLFEITFTSTPSELLLYRASGRYSTDFSLVETEEDGVFTAPLEPGVYLYKINASWGTRGDIQYYFALSVV